MPHRDLRRRWASACTRRATDSATSRARSTRCAAKLITIGGALARDKHRLAPQNGLPVSPLKRYGCAPQLNEPIC